MLHLLLSEGALEITAQSSIKAPKLFIDMSNDSSPKSKKDKNDLNEAAQLRHRRRSSSPRLSDSTSPLDSHLIDVLRQNFDFVTTLADIERDECNSLCTSRRNSGVNLARRRDSLHSLQTSSFNEDERTSSDYANLPCRLRPRCNTSVPSFRYRTTTTTNARTADASPDFGLNDSASLADKMRARLAAFYVELLDDLSQTNEDLQQSKAPPKNLSAHALRRDVKRCLTESHPYLEMMAGFRDIFIWKSPLSSLMQFCVYSYCVYRGWIVSVILFIMLLQLILNYLSSQRNINLGLIMLPRESLPKPKLDLSGAQLVFDVAKYCQMLLEIAADVLEKVKHLFLWTKPATTAKFLVLVVFWFLLSLCISTGTYFTIIGLGLGFKAFVTTYLFHRFPRLQHKLDVFVWFLDRLPTEIDLKLERETQKTPPRLTVPRRVSATIDMIEKWRMSGEQHQTSKDDFEFINESAVASTDVDNMQRAARSCILIDKARNFPHTMGAGTLILTDASLIFAYHRFSKGQRETCTIHFDEIKSIQKTHSIKSFSLFPGGGRAIEIFVENRHKSYQFVGIARRDDFFDELVRCSQAAGQSIQIHEKRD
uniref:GRAM domain-containing protein 4 n=1 Tax=Plectus sambesii TaxID=2011161 RepID=A0A914W4W9_9BILA